MMMEDRPMSLKLIMTLIFTTFNQRAFMNRTVGEIMWGYEDPFIQLINKYFPDMFPFKGKFGLFAEVSMAQWEVGACVLSSVDTSWKPVTSLLSELAGGTRDCGYKWHKT